MVAVTMVGVIARVKVIAAAAGVVVITLVAVISIPVVTTQTGNLFMDPVGIINNTLPFSNRSRLHVSLLRPLHITATVPLRSLCQSRLVRTTTRLTSLRLIPTASCGAFKANNWWSYGCDRDYSSPNDTIWGQIGATLAEHGFFSCFRVTSSRGLGSYTDAVFSLSYLSPRD